MIARPPPRRPRHQHHWPPPTTQPCRAGMCGRTVLPRKNHATHRNIIKTNHRNTPLMSAQQIESEPATPASTKSRRSNRSASSSAQKSSGRRRKTPRNLVERRRTVPLLPPDEKELLAHDAIQPGSTIHTDRRNRYSDTPPKSADPDSTSQFQKCRNGFIFQTVHLPNHHQRRTIP